jgi:hypothetical protein
MSLLTIHSSRSRYESLMHCLREGYFCYHYKNRGITRSSKEIALMTGIWIHKGLELIGKYLKEQKKKELPEDILEGIISHLKEGYFQEVFPKNWQEEGGGFNLSEETIDEWTKERRELTEQEFVVRQQYTFDEQIALCEALLRVFCLRTLPRWMERYKIIAVENDMAFPLVKGEGWEVIQSAKIDWVLQEIATKDLYLVSFKSYKQYDNRTAKSASHDTQGLSESWAFDEYLKLKKIDKRIMGIKMLYLIKGYRKETKRGSGSYETQSPLIRGYRKLTFEGPEYAHSWFIPKPENDSGIGIIGKAFEKFETFSGLGLEELGGVKGWIELLASGSVQEELPDILEQQIIEPEPYMRHQRDIDSWLLQTKYREIDIAQRLSKEGSAKHEVFLDVMFPQNRGACHYPQDCQFIDLCYGTEDERKDDPLEHGFVWRKPHHEAELIQIGEK